MKVLIEKRAAALAAMRAILGGAEKESRALNEEERKKYDSLKAEIESLDERIKRMKEVEDLTASAIAASLADSTRSEDGEGDPGQENRSGQPPKKTPAEPFNHDELERQRSLAFQGWLRGGEARPQERNACEQLSLDYRESRSLFNLQPVSQRVQTTDVPSGGGFLVPRRFMDRFEAARLQYGGLRAFAEVITTQDGGDLDWPTGDDTANKGELLAEASVAGASVQDMAFSKQVWHAHQYSSKMIKVSRKMLRDSGIDLEMLLAEKLGERIGRITAEHFATGTGAGQPEGLAVGSVLGVTAAAAGVMAADELEDLIASIDPALRTGGQFLVHDGVRSHIGKMKDGNGLYLFRGANNSTENLVVHGYPVRVDQGLSSTIAAGQRIAFFGNLRAYKIRDVATMEFRRDESRFVEFNQIAYVAFAEHDGKILNPGDDPIKHYLL